MAAGAASRSRPAGPQVIAAAMKSGAYDPAYYLIGDEEFRKAAALKALCESAIDAAARDFNLETRRAADLDAETLGSLLGTPPMMAERRALVVREASELRKDARAELLRYLEHPASDMLVVLTSSAGAEVDKELASATTVVTFEPMDGAELPKWIVRRVEKELGGSITPGAVSLLAATVGNDLPQLVNELDKLMLRAAGSAIDESAVAELVGVRREETAAELCDAVGAQDAKRALAVLPGLLQQPKASAVLIIMQLGAQFQALAFARALRDEGASTPRISSELFNTFLKGAGVMLGRSWGDAVSAWLRVLDHWTSPALDRALAVLLEADAALKNTRVSSELQILTHVVLALCAESRGAHA